MTEALRTEPSAGEPAVPAPVADVRTFNARRGRLGPSARAAVDQLLPRHGVDVAGDTLDLRRLFGMALPVVVEIGCGRGEATLELARRDPGTGVVAVDVHTAGIASLLIACEREALRNVRVVLGDAIPFLERRIAPGTLAGIRAFFPDPWPKGRHAKRRLIQPRRTALLASRLGPGARLHTATDDLDYAQQMLTVLAAEPLLQNTCTDYAPRPDWRPVTGYERKAFSRGRDVRELLFRRRLTAG